MSRKDAFSRFLGSDPDHLHFTAHSHHPWPDVTFAAHQQAWLDAAALHDDKWERVLGEVLPEAGAHIAARLRLSDATTLAFAPNTHEFVVRLLSCLPAPVRVLTTDAEFHSFVRQVRRLEEEGLAQVTRVPAEPLASFADRFSAVASQGGHDLVFFSHVHFNSGYVVADLAGVVHAVPDPQTFVVVDGYHGFMALPTDLSAVQARAFYLAGGYKYAMAGEGACFLHCPPGYGERPVNTGWFAGFEQLEGEADAVGYARGGARFSGATFDPSGWYRFNAVQRFLDDAGITVAQIHAHVGELQDAFLARVGWHCVTAGLPDRGNFLTFRLDDASDAARCLHEHDVLVDARADRLRVGFGIYHDAADVDALARRVDQLEPPIKPRH